MYIFVLYKNMHLIELFFAILDNNAQVFSCVGSPGHIGKRFTPERMVGQENGLASFRRTFMERGPSQRRKAGDADAG